MTRHLSILGLLLALTVPAFADVTFPDFSSTAGLNLVGDAVAAGNRLQLTPVPAVQAGAAWFTTKQAVESGFVTTFQFQIADPGGVVDGEGNNGADGLAFVIQNDSVSALGSSGGFIGYAEGFGPGIANSLAVEFDTFDNGAFLNDPDGNHVGVQTRGTDPNRADHFYSLGLTSSIPNMSDGNVHTVRISYGPGTMTIFMDGTVPILTVPVDLATTLNLDVGRAFVGFTAATFAAYENHDILNWSFIDVVVPVDIKPGSCPNPINTNDRGVLPLAILGTSAFNVTQVDPASVRLQGVSPLRSTLEDVGTPFVPFTGKHQVSDCTTAGGDGFLDLSLKFDAQAVVAALGPVTDGDVRVLTITGNLQPAFGGTPIAGEDVVVIRKKK